jgi:small subunit ribosomal protein S7
MPPRLNVTSLARAVPFRPRPQIHWFARPASRFTPSQCRPYSDSTPAGNDRSHKLDAQPADHISEEKAKTKEAMGEQGPDMSRGTPIEEVRAAMVDGGEIVELTSEQIVKGDKAAQEHLPKVMKDKLKANANAAPKGSRSYSTSTIQIGGSGGLDMGLVDVQAITTQPQIPGLKFDMPSLPLPKDGHVKHRYDPVVEQVTNLLMNDGKKSVAQSVSSTSPHELFAS